MKHRRPNAAPDGRPILYGDVYQTDSVLKIKVRCHECGRTHYHGWNPAHGTRQLRAGHGEHGQNPQLSTSYYIQVWEDEV